VIPNPNFDANADEEERIHRTELALARTEKMLAENLALRTKIRTAVEAAGCLVKIDPDTR
jgi:hypothetical protein